MGKAGIHGGGLRGPAERRGKRARRKGRGTATGRITLRRILGFANRDGGLGGAARLG